MKLSTTICRNMGGIRFSLLLGILFSSLGWANLSAQCPDTIFVNDLATAGDVFTTSTGDDVLGNGSSSSPFLTFDRALAAADTCPGVVIALDVGQYPETMQNTINSGPLTVIGPNAGNAGCGAPRVGEAVIDFSLIASGGTHISVTTSDQFILDGVTLQDTFQTLSSQSRVILSITNLNGDPVVRNNIFSRDIQNLLTGSSNVVTSRGIVVSSVPVGQSVTIIGNRFQGSAEAGNVFSLFGLGSFTSGIFSNGGPGVSTVTDNCFRRNRSAINIDNITDSFVLDNNEFEVNGTAISIDGTVDTIVFNNNNFIDSTLGFLTFFNLSSVDDGFFLDVTNNQNEGVPFENLSQAELFTMEVQTVHGHNTGKNGLVRTRENQLYNLPASLDSRKGVVQRSENIAFEGDTVNLAPGTYAGQVSIDKDLAIIGDDSSNTIIQGVANMDSTTGSGASTNVPVINIHDAGNVLIEALQVDGDGQGNTNMRYQGIGYRNAGGRVEDVMVKGIRNTPLDGTQQGTGIYAFAFDGNDRTVDINQSCVIDWQKTGIGLFGANLLSATVDSSLVAGADTLTGENNDPAQNAIQPSFGLRFASITNNTIRDVYYLRGDGSDAAGVLDFNADSVFVARNRFINVEAPYLGVNNNSVVIENEMEIIDEGIQAFATTNASFLLAKNNKISQAGFGAFVFNSGAPINAVIKENSFLVDTLALAGNTANEVNAECNWYGTTKLAQINAQVNGNFDINPYLTDGTDTSAAIGFQPDTTSCFGPICPNGECEGCFTYFPFNDTIICQSAPASGVWYTDRFPPDSFYVGVFMGDSTLIHQIDASDGQNNRPSQNTSFANTQGKKYMTDNAQVLQIDLFIPSDWATTNRRMAGLWGEARDSSGAISAFPIIEFASNGGNPRFQIFDDTLGFRDLGLPCDFQYDQFHTLRVEILNSGRFRYSVNDNLTAYADAAGLNQEGFSNVILQGYNNDTGVTYTIYWDDFYFGDGPGLSYDTVLPDPIVIGSGISNENMAVAQTCGINGGIKAFKRFRGDVEPVDGDVPGDTYQFGPGASPESAANEEPDSGTARWNYLISVNLGQSTFNDLNVFLELDFDPSDSACQVGPFVANISQLLRDSGQGGTSFFQSSENFGFDFFQQLGSPDILPFDPDAEGVYDLALRVENLQGFELYDIPIRVEVACEFLEAGDDIEPPLLACPSDTVLSNDAGMCGAIVDFMAMASETCDTAIVTYSQDPNTFFPVGTTTVKVTATDTSGNADSCTFTITVNDTTKPVVSCPADTTLSNDAGQCGAVVNFSATATDECAIDTIIYSQDPGTLFPIGTTTVTATASDTSGNVDTCSFTITVTDDENPVIFCPPNSTISTSPGACSAAFGYTVGTSDNCSGETVTQLAGLPSGSAFPVGITTNTFFVTDSVGNEGDTCSFTVTVNDDENPMITCPAPIVVSNEQDTSGAVVSFNVTATDNCVLDTIIQITGIESGEFFPIGTTTNTFFARDTTGLTDTCSFTVTVNDTANPMVICPGNIMVSNAEDTCGAVVSFSVTSVDNAPGDTVFQIAGLPSDTIFPIGTTLNTFVAQDSTGNSDTCSFTVTVNDTMAPTITCPGNVMTSNDAGMCSAVVSYSVSSSDNCPGQTVTQTAGLPSGSAFPVGTTTNSFVVTDASGNQDSCSFTVTVNDTEDPVIACLADTVLSNDADTCGAVFSYAVMGSDNCPGDSVFQIAGIASDSLFPVGVTTNTFVIEDAVGNTDTCSFTVTVNDTMAPSITCPADITMNNDSGMCSAAVTFSVASNDNCPGEMVTQTAGMPSGSVFPVGTTINTFVVTDASGNQDSCSFTVTVSDAEAPMIACPSDTNVGNDAGMCSAVVSYPMPSAMDNCAIDSVDQIAGMASGSAFPVGVTTNTFVAFDTTGNSDTCSFTVTVNDTMAPVITCISDTILSNDANQCGAVVNFNISSSDNCPGETTVQTSGLPSGSQFPVGMTVNTFVVTDASGNQDSCTFIITVNDTVNPMITCPADIVASNDAGTCGAVVNFGVGSSDNCPGETMAQTAGMPSGSTFPMGVTTNTFVVTDAFGNQDSCSFTVTVNDTEDPVLSCPSDIVVSNDEDTCGAGVSFMVSTTDNCPSDSVYQIMGIASDSLFPIGITTNVFVAEDASGNTDTCTFTVTVNDTARPMAVCTDTTIFLDSNGQAMITPAFVDGGSSDQCSGVSLSVSPNMFGDSDAGNNTVTLTVTDSSGNQRTCQATVLVLDTIQGRGDCDTVRFVTDTTWRMSTVVTPTNNSGNWNGVNGNLPSSGSYTQPVMIGQPYSFPTIFAVDSSKVIKAGNNIRYFRKTIELDDLQGIGARIRSTFDDQMEVYVNGDLLTAHYQFDRNNDLAPGFDAEFESNGTVDNGADGRKMYDFTTSGDLDNFFQQGTNEIVVVLRNLGKSSDAGGFSLSMQVDGCDQQPVQDSVCDTLRVVTNADWTESTTVTSTNFSGNWNGVNGNLPDTSTFTQPVMIGQPYSFPTIDAVDSSQVIIAGNAIRYYRQTIQLDSLTGISARVRTTFDNQIEVYVNGSLLAGDYQFTGNTQEFPPHDARFNDDGTVDNGAGGNRMFDATASGSLDNIFQPGLNDIIVALRNNGKSSDRGGFSLSLQVQGCKGNVPQDSVPPEDTLAFAVISDSGFRKSTQKEQSNFSGNWNGASALPPTSTYTLPAMEGQPYSFPTIDPVDSTKVIKTDNNITFFRKEFELTDSANLDARFRMTGDDGFEIYINQVLIARENNSGPMNMQVPAHDLKYTAGISPVNGFMGGDMFDVVSATNLNGVFVEGTNEVVLAIRNRANANEAGGFSFRLDLDQAGQRVIRKEAEAGIAIEMSAGNGFAMYPNPTTGKLSVEMLRATESASQVQVFDFRGKLLSSETMGDRAELDLTEYSAGVYLIRVISGDEAFTQKVVKE